MQQKQFVIGCNLVDPLPFQLMSRKQYYIGAMNMSIEVVKVTVYSEITQTATVCAAKLLQVLNPLLNVLTELYAK